MHPSEINRLIRNSKLALKKNANTPDAFLLAYIAWEAFQIRILIVGLAANGLSVTEAQKELRTKQVWRQENKELLFRDLYGSRPSNLKYVGKLFNRANKLKNLRDGYVHGTNRTGPEQFRNAALELIRIMDHNWAEDLRRLLEAQGLNSSRTDPLGQIRRLSVY
jgi:hypothetical protein